MKLASSELRALDDLATRRGVSRAELIRLALTTSLPLIAAGHSLDFTRLATGLEFCQAALDGIISREHPDIAARIYDDVLARMEQFHA